MLFPRGTSLASTVLPSVLQYPALLARERDGFWTDALRWRGKPVGVRAGWACGPPARDGAVPGSPAQDPDAPPREAVWEPGRDGGVPGVSTAGLLRRGTGERRLRAAGTPHPGWGGGGGAAVRPSLTARLRFAPRRGRAELCWSRSGGLRTGPPFPRPPPGPGDRGGGGAGRRRRGAGAPAPPRPAPHGGPAPRAT